MKLYNFKSVILILLILSISLHSQTILYESSNQHKYSIRPARGIEIGNNLKKAGLITAILGSCCFTYAIYHAATTHDDWIGVLVPGAIGITFFSVSVPLTFSGFLVKHKHKKRLSKN